MTFLHNCYLIHLIIMDTELKINFHRLAEAERH